MTAWPTSTSMRKMLDVLGSLLAKIQVMNFADMWTGIPSLDIYIPPKPQSSHFVALDPEVSIQRRTRCVLAKEVRRRVGKTKGSMSAARFIFCYLVENGGKSLQKY